MFFLLKCFKKTQMLQWRMSMKISFVLLEFENVYLHLPENKQT